MSKTVNILTIHDEPNYGAVLQAYALYHTVEILGCTPRMINLSLKFRLREYNLLNRILIAFNNWKNGYNYCNNIARAFCRTYEPNTTRQFCTIEQLRNYNWNSDDYFLLGSDQIWNTEITHNLAKAYTFSFLPDECIKRYAYASSFGNIKDEKKRAKELEVQSSLAKFKGIGVREKFGVEFLKTQGIESVEVIDPTLLLKDYSFLLPRPIEYNNCLLYLALGEDSEMNTFVTQLSQMTKLTINKHYGYLQPSRKVNKQFLSVQNWLYYIASSKLVVTDSFHAMVFSIMFHRQFYVFVSHPSKVYRINNILKRLGIEGRVVTNLNQVNLDSTIDYAEVAEKLDDLRISSLNYLSQILGLGNII